jgi:hypothetical protein
MTQVVALQTKAELTAGQRVADFIALARDELSNLIPTAAWASDAWDVSAAFVRKGKPRAASRLYFYQHGTLTGRADKATGTPFHPAFRDFAKAYIRYTHSAAPMAFERLQARLHSLAFVEAAFRAFGREAEIHHLSPELLTRAALIGTAGVTQMVRYQRGVLLEKLFDFCSRQRLLASSFQWRHGIQKPKEPGERIGVEFERRRSEKLPSRRAFEALAHVYCHAQTLRDELLSAIALIAICSPWRASEILQLRLDSEVTATRRDGDKDVPAYGLRAFPGKDNQPQVKWVPDVAVDQVQAAFRRLSSRCSEARAMATWYVANPGRIYLPPEFEHLRNATWLTADQVADLVGQTKGHQWAKKVGLGSRVAGKGLVEYRFSDLERAVIEQLPQDFPYQNGLSSHQYSEALILVRQGALRADTVGDGSRVMFEPIDINQFNRWLSGTTQHQTVFERYGFTEEDGSPISITTHAFRHWNNNIGHRAGLSQEDLALWSGRDPGQNKYYDHQTPAEFQADLLEMARKAGGVGPVFEAADQLPEFALITRDEFLRQQIGSSHATEVGVCFHDYALQPCQNHGDCITCEENGFIKGDPQHRGVIERQLGLIEMQLAAARAAMSEGDYGADIWVHEHERKVDRLRLMLSKHDDAAIPNGAVVTLPSGRHDSEIEQAMRLRAQGAGR